MIQGIIKAPCKDCPNRVQGCHATCQAYKSFKKKSDEFHEYKIKRNDVTSDFLNIRYKNGKYERILKWQTKRKMK